MPWARNSKIYQAGQELPVHGVELSGGREEKPMTQENKNWFQGPQERELVGSFNSRRNKIKVAFYKKDKCQT